MYPGPKIDRNQEIPEGIIDSDRIEQIICFNEFASENLKEFNSLTELNMNESEKNTGLWIMPSYFNHSCLPNAARFFLQDFVVFYAIRDIEENEEITTGYVGCMSYKERQEVSKLIFHKLLNIFLLFKF